MPFGKRWKRSAFQPEFDAISTLPESRGKHLVRGLTSRIEISILPLSGPDVLMCLTHTYNRSRRRDTARQHVRGIADLALHPLPKENRDEQIFIGLAAGRSGDRAGHYLSHIQLANRCCRRHERLGIRAERVRRRD